MAVARRLDETREMRLFTKVIASARTCPDSSLPQFIATRRQPDSEQWMTWDEITIALNKITGEVVTDVSLRRWASRYGIPEGTLRTDSPITQAEYARALKEHGIKI